MLKGDLELLAVGTECAGRDEAWREVGVDTEAGCKGDRGENGGEGEERARGIGDVGPGRERERDKARRII